jgi:hypothetical protein
MGEVSLRRLPHFLLDHPVPLHGAQLRGYGVLGFSRSWALLRGTGRFYMNSRRTVHGTSYHRKVAFPLAICPDERCTAYDM